MVPANSWKQALILEDGFPEFSLKATRALNRIISVSNPEIVLTTSHKHSYTLSDWKGILERRNIAVRSISRLPENTGSLNRRDELLRWFDSNSSLDDFIIIDDDKSLNALPNHLKERLIQTSASVGLTDYLADEAIELMKALNSQLS